MKTEHVVLAARAAHEVNRAYCQALGDNSQPSWEDAPEWQKKSAINGVAFHAANPGAGPAASHESWLKEKLSDGWQHGPVKDVDAKTHPCCLPYGELPAEQRAKDFLFIATMNQIVAVLETETQEKPQPGVPAPTVGRVVHYQAHGSPNGQHKSLPRAAIITAVHEDGGTDVCVLNPTGMFFNPRTPFSAEPKAGHWNWPPRA